MNTVHKNQQGQFDQAYRIAAKLIVDYGEKYLPIFERMHNEKLRFESHKHLADVALQASISVAE